MLHRPVYHQILLTVVLRLGGFGRLGILRAGKQLETQGHLRQGAGVAESRNADFRATVIFSGTLLLGLRLRRVRRCRSRHRPALLFERGRSARSDEHRRQYAHRQTKSSHVYPAMPRKHAHDLVMRGRCRKFNAIFLSLIWSPAFPGHLLYQGHVADATQKFKQVFLIVNRSSPLPRKKKKGRQKATPDFFDDEYFRRIGEQSELNARAGHYHAEVVEPDLGATGGIHVAFGMAVDDIEVHRRGLDVLNDAGADEIQVAVFDEVTAEAGGIRAKI